MRTFLVFSALLLAVFAPITQASVIQLEIDPAYGSSENTGSTALLTLAFSESGGSDLLTLTITNTTPVAIGSKLTAVGFELPDTLSLTPTFAAGGESSYFDEIDFNVSTSPGWLSAAGGYDLMLTSDGNFEGGNANGGPEAGESQVVVLNLGDTGLSILDLENEFVTFHDEFSGTFAIARFQAVGPDAAWSDKVLHHVPEPVALMLLAVGGLVLPRRRSSRTRAA